MIHTKIIVKFDLTSNTKYLGFIFKQLANVSLSNKIVCILNNC